MESSVKERLIDFITYKGLNKNAFESMCGLSSRYVSNITKMIGADKLRQISAVFPELNTEWLLSGNGSMLLPQSGQPIISQHNVNGRNNVSFGNIIEDAEVIEDTTGMPTFSEIAEAEGVRKPILPTEITYRADVDALDYVQNNPTEVEKSRVIVMDHPIDLWHLVRDDSLYPDAKRGDSLALSAYPIGEEDPIPGKLHAVDTKTNGIVIRKLEHCKGGYKAIAPNKENYPDMVILKKNITRIYRVTFLCRVL